MNTLSEDRLKAFLDRNRNRISHQSDSLSLDCLDKNILAIPVSYNDKVSDIESTKADSLQTTENLLMSHEIKGTSLQNNEIKRGRKELAEPKASTTYYSANSSEGLHLETHNHLTTTETPKQISAISSSFPSNKLKILTNAAGKLKPLLNKRLYSASPSNMVSWESSISKNKNRIQSYIQECKKAHSKVRARVRSLSNEPSLVFKPSKTSYIGSNSSSTKIKEFESIKGSSTFTENHGTPSSSKSVIMSTRNHRGQFSAVFSAQEKKKPYTKNNPTGNKVDEVREFCYEETENVERRDKSRSKKEITRDKPRLQSKGNYKSRPQSKSKSPCISPIRVPQEKNKKETTQISTKNTERGRTRDKSVTKEDTKLFSVSSQKLATLDSTLNNGHKFKKEIKNLIGVIKQEREQIGQEVETMAKELKKYKSAYKKLKQKVQTEKKIAEEVSQEKLDINSFNISKIKAEDRPSIQTPDQVEERMFLPFTINELTQYIENSVPVQNEENIETLLSKIDSVHTDVEIILSKNESDLKSLQKIQGSKSFELRKTLINQYIIKEMNLKPSLFFQDAVAEDMNELKPNLIDLLTAQREIIYFLVKKIQIEEQQRLKTEEQAYRVMSYMEKTAKHLECKNTSILKKELFSQRDLNKSNASHSTCKFDITNHSMESG